MIGSEKPPLTLDVAAEHQRKPLSYKDVSVLDIAVSEIWNGEALAERLKTASKKTGYTLCYQRQRFDYE